jgi:predicted RNA binding protein YcfA (HicA-like mRNA interferase family)
MGGIAGVPHQRAVRALEKAGFKVVREGRHIVMQKDRKVITIPRHDPVDAYTLGGLVRDAGLTPEQFRKLL